MGYDMMRHDMNWREAIHAAVGCGLGNGNPFLRAGLRQPWKRKSVSEGRPWAALETEIRFRGRDVGVVGNRNPFPRAGRGKPRKLKSVARAWPGVALEMEIRFRGRVVGRIGNGNPFLRAGLGQPW